MFLRKNKIIVSLLIFVFNCSLLASQQHGKTIQIITPSLENIGDNYESWLPGQIRDSLREKFRNYTDYTLTIDESNERKLKELQRKSEGAFYDDQTMIEACKITNAQFALFTTIRKAGSQYIVSVTILNLTTGINNAIVNSSGKKDVENLFSGNNSAVDELILKLCDQLDIKLTPTQRFVLQHGTDNLSVEQQLDLEKQSEINYKKRLDELNKQLSNTIGSTDLDVVAKRQQLEAELSLTEEKQQTALRHQKELQERLAQEQKDREQENLRSIALLEKRNALEKEVEEAASKIRKEKLDKQSVLGQINIIESKKKALVSIRDNVDLRLQELTEEAEYELAEYKTALQNEPLRAGEPEEIALQRRTEKYESRKKELKQRVEKEQSAVIAKVEKQDSELLKDIRKNQKEIEKKRCVSSFGNELQVSYGSYDAKNTCWPAHISLYADGILLDEDEVFIYYENLTGKTVPNLAKANETVYNNYLDTIDTYNSLLMRGSPILNYELDYKVEALPDEYPSSYKFTFLELRVKETSKNKLIQIPKLKVENLVRNWAPAYDIQKHEKKESEELKSETQRYRENHFDQTRGNGGFSGLRIGGGYASENTFCLDLNYSLGFAYTFFIFDLSYTSLPFELKKISKSDHIISGTAGYGFNKRIMIGPYPPTVFCWSSLGLCYLFLKPDCCNLLESSDSYISSSGGLFLINRSAVGLEIPFSKRRAIYTQGNLNWILNKQNNPYITYDVVVGLSLCLN